MTLSSRSFWLLLSVAILIRLLSLAGYPLMDTTEARYGEMARLMVETGNWVTPQIDYNIPFWGKPPLFTWVSALGIELFGRTEFAVRFPHWLAGIATLAVIGYFAKKIQVNIYAAILVLATCGIFAIASGAVMTDMLLTLSIALTMVAIYLSWQCYERAQGVTRKGYLWGYLGFVGLGVGLLAKGPLAIVLVGLAVFPWLLIQHGIKGAFVALWQRFPIISGSFWMLAIALPWYLAAEHATPGFLDYFIVGEHFKRFIVSGWEGDLYGSAHNQVRGTIWVYWLTSSAPWSFIFPILLWKRKTDIKTVNTNYRGLFSFLFLWMLAPLVLFTFAGNILPAYVLPGIPALALLVAVLLKEGDEKWFQGVALIIPVVLIVALIYLNLGKGESRSDKYLLSDMDTSLSIFYIDKRPFSGQFYSNGRAKLYQGKESLKGLTSMYLIGKKEKVSAVIAEDGLHCDLQISAKSKRNRYLCTR